MFTLYPVALSVLLLPLSDPVNTQLRMMTKYSLRALHGRDLRKLALVSAALTLAAMAGCVRYSASEESSKSLIDLGKNLFEDQSLSADASVSCATCHVPSRQFSDGRMTSRGVGGHVGTRNAMSIQDIKFVRTFFWDGRESRLENAVLQPFTNAAEMGLPNLGSLTQRVEAAEAYPSLFLRAFGDTGVSESRIAEALAAYLRSLPLPRTKFEHARIEGTELGEDVRLGFDLFKGKAACTDCHLLDESPASFTDHKFHHTGVGSEKVVGRMAEMLDRLETNRQKGLPIGNAVLVDADLAELGRFAVTQRPEDLGAFRTPTLRNVARTAPYMHDGSIATLEEAIDRELYYRGLARGRPISLTVDERRQLGAFLHMLNTSH
ncbi:cytochrome-c peroxidase [Pseudoxanthomonas mexicana]